MTEVGAIATSFEHKNFGNKGEPQKKGGGIGEADNGCKCSKQLSMHQMHILVGSIY